MSTARKPRPDAKLKTLPPERRAVIAEHLRSHTLDETQAWLAADGLKTSRSALSEFLSWFAQQEELQATNDLLLSFEGFCREKNPDWNEEKVRSAGIQFFLANSVARKDAEQFANIVTLDQRERFGRTKAAQDERRLNQQDRKIALLEKKAAAYDQVKAAVNSGGLTPETLAKIERELKLL